MGVLEQPVLVLNSGMIAIDLCTVRKAVPDLFRATATTVVEGDDVLRSPSVSIRVPRIISYFNYHKVPRKRVRFSRLNVIYRDDQRCVYCRKRYPVKDLTVDHVIPRSRWRSDTERRVGYAFNSWENLVSACQRCNATKANRLLSELGWRIAAPREPEYMPHLVIKRSRAEAMGWLDYCGYNVRLIDAL